MNEVPYGKLIGKIGDNEPFIIGANLEISASASGKLDLAVNDHYFPDNSGAYEVTITDPTLYDDFNNPAFEGTFDQERWAAFGALGQIEQHDGKMVYTLKPSEPGVHAFWLSPTQPQPWTLDRFHSIEAKLRLSSETETITGGFESFALGLIAPLTNNRELTPHCFIGRDEMVYVKCNVYIWDSTRQNTEVSYQAYVNRTTLNSEHTVRIDIDPEVNVTFSIDGQQFDSYRPPEADEVKDGPFYPRIWIYSTTQNSIKGYLDDVRIGQVGS
jgi:hypothetical protein